MAKIKKTNKVNKKIVTKKEKCPHADNCGGCQLQSLTYDEQLAFKQEKIEKLLSNFCHVEEIIGCDHLNYRNKVQVSFGLDDKKKVIVGNYVPSTHFIVPVKDCMIADKKANQIIETIRKLVIKHKISIFNENTYKGCIRHVQIRSTSLNEYMVILVTGTPKIYKGELLIKDLLAKHKEIKTVVQNINNKRTSMVLSNKNVVLYGNGYIKDELCGLKFNLSPTSFYQVNKYQTEVLYSKALELGELSGEETAIDAYCGIGTISLLLAKKVKRVLGVEINSSAIKDAKHNAKNNQIDNVSFVCDDAGKFMTNLSKDSKTKVDLVCMDPPRAGADEKFLRSLITLSPKKIIYISCGPDSLKSNLGFLTKKGYKVKTIQPVDMFPYTEHVETIVILEKNAEIVLQNVDKEKNRNISNRKYRNNIRYFLICLVCVIVIIFFVQRKGKTVDYSNFDILNKGNNLASLFVNKEELNNIQKQLEYYLSLEAKDAGYDVYYPKGNGYRYGPSIIKNNDGTYDVYFASPGNNSTEWDYIRYSHIDESGEWSKESIVLKPSPKTYDHYSVCDPGLIYFNGYYYLAYTSTKDGRRGGINNEAFVARSKNPDGPFEKWSGGYWGDDPVPFIPYEYDDGWGLGEISFVVKDEQLFIYYTYESQNESSTRVCVSDLSENWPANIEYKGTAIIKQSGQDSSDVVYVEELNEFVAICVIERLSSSSKIGIYRSSDGLYFNLNDMVREDIKSYAHNIGISKDLKGHVSINEDLLIGYAYSPYKGLSWGRWATRFQEVNLVTKIKK